MTLPLTVLNSQESSDCRAAQQAYADAAVGKAVADEARREAARKYSDDLDPERGVAIGVAFTGCLLTSGVIAVFTPPPINVLVISGAAAGCVAMAAYQMWELARTRAQDRDALGDADDRLRNAEERYELARRALNRSCPAVSGCGSRGGPGYQRPDGKCAGWHDWGYA